MIFTVVWIPAALNQLADLWIQAADRQAVTDAADRIDRVLRVDAHKKGLPLNGGRFLTHDPLAVTFTLDLDDRIVKVLQVKRTSP